MLRDEGVSDVVPNYGLWMVDRRKPECLSGLFAVPPREAWRNIAPALRFVRDHVEPAIGPVRVASAYRDQRFNACVGGARASAHRAFYALDLVPADTRIGRKRLIETLCPLHLREGRRAHIGLGIYPARRFHIDARGYRRWGGDYHSGSSPCLRRGN